MIFKFDTMGQYYETFYHGNLLTFYGNYRNNIALKHRMTHYLGMAVNYNGKKLTTVATGPCLLG
jgi:hypothetical protein